MQQEWWKHKRRKCSSCGTPSGGNTICLACEGTAQDYRDELRARRSRRPIVVEDSDDEFRRRRLREAEFSFYRGVSHLCQGLLIVVELLCRRSQLKGATDRKAA